VIAFRLEKAATHDMKVDGGQDNAKGDKNE